MDFLDVSLLLHQVLFPKGGFSLYCHLTSDGNVIWGCLSFKFSPLQLQLHLFMDITYHLCQCFSKWIKGHMICIKPLVDVLRAQSIFVFHRCCKSASGSRGDADGWSHHEEVRSLSEDHPTLLCGHADHFHPPLHPSFLHGLSHTEGLRGQW